MAKKSRTETVADLLKDLIGAEAEAERLKQAALAAYDAHQDAVTLSEGADTIVTNIRKKIKVMIDNPGMVSQ